jgi:cytochrome P450
MELHSPKTLTTIPVAPGSWPVIGHLRQFASELPDFLMRNERDLGPLYWVNNGFGHWSVVVCGDAAHTVMKNKLTRSDIMGGDDDHITGHTLLIHDGVKHKRMRGAMNSPFTPKGLTGANVGQLLVDVALERLEAWKGKRSIKVLDETSDYALDIIFRMLGIPGADLPIWRQKFNEFIGPWIIVPTKLPGSPRWKSARAAEWMDREFARLVERARETGDRETMLGALAHGTDEEGKGLESHELMANLRILALAGHETTAATVAWMLIHLGADESLWEQIAGEVSASEKLPATPKEMEAFPLTEALFREALRLYPVVTLLPPRRVEEEFEVNGITIPRNTRVAASLLSLSRDEEKYPNPEAIDLQRWAGLGRKPKPSESVQFGGGPHFCLGYHLAVMEGVVLTVAIVQQLLKSGLRLQLDGPVPKPRYMPLTRPPGKTVLSLV